MPTPPIEKPELSPCADVASDTPAAKQIARMASLLRITLSFREENAGLGHSVPAVRRTASAKLARRPGSAENRTGTIKSRTARNEAGNDLRLHHRRRWLGRLGNGQRAVGQEQIGRA